MRDLGITRTLLQKLTLQIVYAAVDRINLAQDKNQWPAVVIAATNLLIQ
jgi:hypothetical protein